MDIGTAKVTNEERGGITHHLIDIVEPDEPYDAARFTEDALLAIREIHKRGRVPLLTGGTGLYLRALISGIFEGPPSDSVIRKKLKTIGGDGGIIAVDKDGNYTMTFNTAGMYRGVITSDGLMEVRIFEE